jgi:aspartate kinase
MATLVMKFGGSLTADTKRISRVAQVIMAESLAWQRMLVVVSAMAGATDMLARATSLAASRNAGAYRHIIADLRQRHLDVITTLFDNEAARRDLTGQIDRLLYDVLTTCDLVATRHDALPRDYDVIMAAGERMMAYILTALVRQEGLQAVFVDASLLIVTDDRYQSANPLIDLIDERVEQVLRPLLDAGIVPLVTGFIGATKNGTVTTLGRGGSDYTATILAASVRADEVWMWTYVDGVMSADPALVPGTRVIPVLSYQEVGELSFFGAHVVHPRAVEPLLSQGIPLRVRNPFNLDHAGTLIQAENDETGTALKAVTAVDGLYLFTEGRSIDMAEFLGQVHRIVGRTATGPVIVMQTHLKCAIVFVVPTTEGPTAAALAAQKLSAGLSGWEISPVKVIAMMGTSAQPALWESINTDNTIHPLASVVGPGDRRLIAVPSSEVQAAVRQLHKLTNQPIRSSRL